MASLGHELSEEASAKLFAKIDEDGSGTIDYEEFFTVASVFKVEDGVFTADQFKSHISNRSQPKSWRINSRATYQTASSNSPVSQISTKRTSPPTMEISGPAWSTPSASSWKTSSAVSRRRLV